jgi:aspartate kinase
VIEVLPPVRSATTLDRTSSQKTRIIIQKFGGSSVASAERMRACAEKAVAARRDGNHVVIVVSARGDTTDDLLGLASEVAENADKRELDQLLATGEQISIALMAMTIQSLGCPAISLTGQQCGVRTDNLHTRSRITAVDHGRLLSELLEGKIPVVAGFQGINHAGDVTTLGRGGSDTSAVALAAALKADECEIYTDVDGIYTADPRIVPNARLLDAISYDEMMEAASQGAKVMHLRSVELGKKQGVAIRVKHSQRHGLGTLICEPTRHAGHFGSMEQSRAVSTVALKTDLGRVTLEDLPNMPGLQREIFDRIARAGISVDDIIQHEVETGSVSTPGERCNIVFTLDKTDLTDVQPIIDEALKAIGRGRSRVDLGLVKVSAVGVGMQSQPGVAATMFRALADAGVTIHNITTSEIKISCILLETDGHRALRVVHDAFGLGNV